MVSKEDRIKKIQEKVGVIHVEFAPRAVAVSNEKRQSLRTSEESLEEAVNLAEALNLEVIYSDIVSVRKPNPRTVIGKGKLEELDLILQEHDADLLFVNFQLSPTHQKNLEQDLKLKVIDRTGLILEIFSNRARTKSGKIQVELARTLYEQTRLVRTWTHLERQRGGLGKTGGPGERQLELDRRILRDKITKLKKHLADVEKTRVQHSKRRKSQNMKVVSLVGYTNSGKSTLFNALTDAGTLSKDMLFATLDPLMRKVKLPSGETIILSDTVGFISDLPHELVESFNSTMQEILDSDLLLHIHDASSKHYVSEKQDVQEVLKSIDAEEIKRIDVLNKIDLIEDESSVIDKGVKTSALKQDGLAGLLQEIETSLELNYTQYNIQVGQQNTQALNYLYKYGKDVEILDAEEDVYSIQIRLKKENYHSYLKQFEE
ncbi:MAG: GTPase HflX [Proteobacteria bacterium]|nr:GTPase HflX [Pseudomonadota bacterium]